MRKRTFEKIGIVMAAVLALTSCGSQPGKNDAVSSLTPDAAETVSGTSPAPDGVTTITETSTPTPIPFVAEQVGVYEAEDAAFAGNVKAVTGSADYSGNGYAEGFKADNDSCTFTVRIEETGFYDLVFRLASTGGEKYNFVAVDGEASGEIYVNQKSLTDATISRVYMEAGEHQVTVSKSWGWINLDNLSIWTSKPIDPAIYQVSKQLSNPNASEITKRLYSYLADIYGKQFLSGQVCDEGMYGKEMQVINKATGKTPAIMGVDLTDYTPSRVEHGASGKTIEHIINFWKAGGIAEVHWHWNAPSKYLTGQWYSGFYKEYTNIDIKKIMNGGDQEGYDLLMADIDAIAAQLLRLKDAGIPVLFRPLHEASGGWFWWGTGGPEAYIKLYTLLYDRLTNEYGLDNLIWVWNGQSKDWYPGDEYVDIIGMDIYPGEQVYTSQASKYFELTTWSDVPKMIYLTECGCIFDPELAYRDGAMWGMWAVWQGEFVRKDGAIASLSERYTEKYMMQKAYDDERVITLDELPDFATYPME